MKSIILTAVLLLAIATVAINTNVYAKQHSQEYKLGFKAGVRDGHHGGFHQNTMNTLNDYDGDHPNGFGQGYVDGWRSTCKEMGLTTGPDSGCELSMDTGNP